MSNNQLMIDLTCTKDEQFKEPNTITGQTNVYFVNQSINGEVWKFFRGSTQPLLNGLEETNHITDECYIFRQLLCLGHACNLIIRENVKT